jgi:nuclear pore complex protein Nup43
MKLWDLRVNKNDITTDINNFTQVMLIQKCSILGYQCLILGFQTQVPITCIAQHPSQKHFIFTGSEEGDVGVWDMRTNSLLTTMSSGDTTSLSELVFHPLEPDNLFSCSFGGRLLQWSSKKSFLCYNNSGLCFYRLIIYYFDGS